MTYILQNALRMAFLSVLWLLVRGLQLILELCELQAEADAVSNAELYLGCKIQTRQHKVWIALKRRWEARI